MMLNNIEINELLSKNKFSITEIKNIANSPVLKEFIHIDLSNKKLSDKKASFFISSKYLSNLTDLDLSFNELTKTFVHFLVKSDCVPNLINLNLHANKIESIVIPDLVFKFKNELNNKPLKDDISCVCNIAIYFNGAVWMRLLDAFRDKIVCFEDLDDLKFEELEFFEFESNDTFGIESLVLYQCEDFYIVKGDVLGVFEVFESRNEATDFFNDIKSELEK